MPPSVSDCLKSRARKSRAQKGQAGLLDGQWIGRAVRHLCAGERAAMQEVAPAVDGP
jgi:hypothetical protein